MSTETGIPPTEKELVRLLGDAHAAFEAIRSRAGSRTEWKRYSKTSPWVLKVIEGDRTLLYATPAEGSFEVTILLGPRATEAALAGRVAKRLHGAIRKARAYAEGRPVRVTVRGLPQLASVEQLLAVKLDPAGERPRPSRRKRTAE